MLQVLGLVNRIQPYLNGWSKVLQLFILSENFQLSGKPQPELSKGTPRQKQKKPQHNMTKRYNSSGQPAPAGAGEFLTLLWESHPEITRGYGRGHFQVLLAPIPDDIKTQFDIDRKGNSFYVYHFNGRDYLKPNFSFPLVTPLILAEARQGRVVFPSTLFPGRYYWFSILESLYFEGRLIGWTISVELD